MFDHFFTQLCHSAVSLLLLLGAVALLICVVKTAWNVLKLACLLLLLLYVWGLIGHWSKVLPPLITPTQHSQAR